MTTDMWDLPEVDNGICRKPISFEEMDQHPISLRKDQIKHLVKYQDNWVDGTMNFKNELPFNDQLLIVRGDKLYLVIREGYNYIRYGSRINLRD